LINQVSSQRIALIRFPLAVGVVYGHSYASEIGYADGTIGISNTSNIVEFIRYIISNELAHATAPLFFLLSGYLFFVKFEWSLKAFSRKIVSRFHSLLVPFLFWNLSAWIIIHSAKLFPSTRIYFSEPFIRFDSYSFWGIINSIFGIDQTPAAYPLWFLRDLIILVLLVPLLQLVLHTIPRIFLCLTFLLWFFKIWLLYLPSILSVFFFYFGAYWAVFRKDLFEVDKYRVWITISYFIILFIDFFSRNSASYLYIHQICIFSGILFFLQITQFAHRFIFVQYYLLLLSTYSFFIYVSHEPLLTIIRKLTFRYVAPGSSATILMLYLALPIITIILSLLIYKFLYVASPVFLNLITGKRINYKTSK